MDVLTREQRRKTMQTIRSSGSKIESTLAKELWRRGYRYRKNDKTVFGKPDISFRKIKLAIFVDSEFWHGKDWESSKKNIKSNTMYWYPKIERNIKRDVQVNQELSSQGWKIIRIWGQQVIKNLDFCLRYIEKEIDENCHGIRL